MTAEQRERHIKSLHMSPEAERLLRDFWDDMDRIHAQMEEQRTINAEQAEINKGFDKRLANLEYKIEKAEREAENQKELLQDYYGQLDWLLLQQSGTTPGSREHMAWQNKIVTKRNQIRKAESKWEDLKKAKDMAEQELSASL
jgi:hypothetical protein